MAGTVMLFVAVVAAFVILIARRTPSGGLVHEPSRGLYSQVGNYPMSAGRLTVSVELGVLQFEVRNGAGELLCSNGELHPSQHHRWLFSTGADGSLWLYSGDLGIHCWKPGPSGRWVSVDTSPGAPARRMAPHAFVTALGSHTARGLSSEGVKPVP